MECKDHYPDDFKAALNRTPLQNNELEALPLSSSTPPIFVYNHLKLPTVLKYFIEKPEASGEAVKTKLDIIPATLPEYKLYHFAKKDEPGLPHIKRSESCDDAVQGMLIFGLTDEQRTDIQEFECGCSAQIVLAGVTTQIAFMDKIHGYEARCWKSVDAATFVWRSEEMDMMELKPTSTSYWPVDEFIAGPLYAKIVEQQHRMHDKTA